ncbi:hypothetical protein APY04_3486 [Hyphomicrobium sulfonivorans]|uniref:Uncharacterized protein n=1 Tax=Hyphomicrobium sulfonivorans TaxID=121290 RepID=A0A109B921_HYPSL|nr:hypothetical protein [Hyphomicrobium sulfonivorans]KWT64222.1 hypothetical protein APY04_3486 [Hyphomicrobium sulfonivorans]
MEDFDMQAMDIHETARRLREAKGESARAIAAQKARAYEDEGNLAEARNWRRIEATLDRLQGPRMT